MSKKDKLLARLLSRPKDLEWEEVVTLLGYFGIFQSKTGKTGGSRTKFRNVDGNIVIVMHKPHDSNGKAVLKPYAIDIIIEQLRQGGLL